MTTWEMADLVAARYDREIVEACVDGQAVPSPALDLYRAMDLALLLTSTAATTCWLC
jgi:hypothetical protein